MDTCYVLRLLEVGEVQGLSLKPLLSNDDNTQPMTDCELNIPFELSAHYRNDSSLVEEISDFFSSTKTYSFAIRCPEPGNYQRIFHFDR